MQYPYLTPQSATRQMTDVFAGYNHNLRIADGEFYHMENMTSDGYPVLSPRVRRGIYQIPAQAGQPPVEIKDPQGLIAKDALCYVDAGKFYINGMDVGLTLTPGEKQLISMGAYVIILPDRKYINTISYSDCGSLDAAFDSQGTVTFRMCNAQGQAYENITHGEEAPEDRKAVWVDTSAQPYAQKQWSESAEGWVRVPSTYLRIEAAGIGDAFERYDGVVISGILPKTLQSLNAAAVVWEKGEGYIVITGIVDATVTQTESIHVERRMPDMDFVVESGNRLWGCKYGEIAGGQVVNQIYASKLGDFKNWTCYMGISSDSYYASVGSDGAFTAAAVHLGYPLFFKEHCLHKVYGDYPANFQVQTTACRGVQQGCHKSLAIVGETLFYKARSGIMAYDGALPVEASYALGAARYSDAAAGALGNKYYVSMADESGGWHLFVYDAAKGMWHREDSLHAKAFCACRGELYCIDADTKRILALLGSGVREQEPVKWEVQTGEMGLSSPDMKYISGLTVRMSMDTGAVAEFYAQYDLSNTWEHLCTIRGKALRSFNLPIHPRRSDHMKLKIAGTGQVKIYAITKTITEGSELS